MFSCQSPLHIYINKMPTGLFFPPALSSLWLSPEALLSAHLHRSLCTSPYFTKTVLLQPKHSTQTASIQSCSGQSRLQADFLKVNSQALHLRALLSFPFRRRGLNRSLDSFLSVTQMGKKIKR